MIIESAFLKLPELLTSNFDHGDTFEATVVHLLATAVHMELNSRNIPRTFEHVYIEKPYPTKGEDGRAIRADLFVNLDGAVLITSRMALYGTRERNWIEAKAFVGSTRTSSTPTKTVNGGKVLRDLLRLCLLPQELQGSIRQNGRYMLIVSNSNPSAYIAMKDRVWLSRLFSEGITEIEVDMLKEPDSLRGAVGQGFIQSPHLILNLKLQNRVFEPSDTKPAPIFWGYLTRILRFWIKVSDSEIEYDDTPDYAFDEAKANQLQAVQTEVLKRMGRVSEE